MSMAPATPAPGPGPGGYGPDGMGGSAASVERGLVAFSGAMSPAEIKGWVERVQEMRRAVLVEGVDYGVIEGTQEPTLYDAGAQKMALLAGVGFQVSQVFANDRGVMYHCTVTRPGTDLVMAECDGYCGYDESRYFQTVEQQKAKAERNERYYAKKDNRPVRPDKWANVPEYRAPWNTLVKMAQKRARVGAISAALALGGLFKVEGDDLGEPPDQETGEIPGQPPARAAAAQSSVPAPGPTSPVAAGGPVERGRRRDTQQVPVEVYDNEPEAMQSDPNDAGRPF